MADLNPGARPFQPHTLLAGMKGAVLLQTAGVHVFNLENPSCCMKVRAVLDTGSQQSYVSKQVKDTLALTPQRQQMLSVMTFTSSEPKTQMCDVVSVDFATRDGIPLKLDLFTIPVTCQPLTTQPIDLCVTRYKHLAGLDLADASNNETSMPVDLLIGLLVSCCVGMKLVL